MIIDVFSDGSAQTKDKPGGWAWVLVVNGMKHSEGSGHVEKATNNDMELESSIQGLAAALKIINIAKENSKCGDYALTPTGDYIPTYTVTLVSDSQIVLGWASGTYKFKQLDKIEKYEQLRFVMKRLNAKTRWVKGHSGDEHNERCDKLAKDARKGITTKDLDNSGPKPDTKIGTKKNGVASLWYAGQLKIVDFENGIIENYNREVHGKRGSMIEIREEKSR